ncbi:MAG: hypothetical protein WDW38_010797 [Sanguina aurantia]
MCARIEGACSSLSLTTFQQVAVAVVVQAVLLDQFGVLHDGRVAVPTAVAAVAHLAEAGVTVLIISNSSRRSSGTLGKLASLGYNPSHFAGAVTSGELTHTHLRDRPSPWWQALGRSVLHLNWSGRGPVSLQGLGLAVVQDPRDADFILAHGTEGISLPASDGREEVAGSAGAVLGGEGSEGVGVGVLSPAAMQQLLQGAAQLSGRAELSGLQVPSPVHVAAAADEDGAALQACSFGGLPLILANPDLVTVDGSSLITMPGTLARQYSQAGGGPVIVMGKPGSIIYAACTSLLPDGLLPADVLAIGDSLEHDIAGAAAAGFDSLLIAGGIHAWELLSVGAVSDVVEQASSFTDDGGPGTASSSMRQAHSTSSARDTSLASLQPDAVNSTALEALCRRHSAWPTYVMSRLAV